MTLYIGTTCCFPIQHNIALQVYNKSTSNIRLILKKRGRGNNEMDFVRMYSDYVNSTIGTTSAIDEQQEGPCSIPSIFKVLMNV